MENNQVPNYHIYWSYDLVKHGNPVSVTVGTTCFIKNNGEIIATGHSVLSPKEPRFVKEVGRKLSLRRALQEGNFSKEERTVIWQRYFNR